MAVMAMAEGGTLLNAPDIYMDKIAIGPGYAEGVIDLDAPAEDNIRALAKAKGVEPAEITACILDRPRHAELIAAVRKAGRGGELITDGDVAGVIATADPETTGIDIYIGNGGAPEGVLAAAALALHRRPDAGPPGVRDTEEKRERARSMGIKDFAQANTTWPTWSRATCMFAATGVTDGSHARGRAFRKGVVETETVVMRSDRHRALDPRRASPYRQVPVGLS